MSGRDEEAPGGSGLGLPEEGPGSVASVLSRVLAFLLDVATGSCSAASWWRPST